MADLEMFRGDHFVYDAVVRVGGSVQNVTGWDFWFTAKQAKSLPDNLATIRQDTAALGGITITDAPSGKVRVTAPPVATYGLPDGDVLLYYDLQGRDGTGTIRTVDVGTLVVHPDVTRAIS